MARTALLYVFPALLVVTSWLGLEEPQRGGRLFAAAVLALVPALVRPWWARVLAALAGAAVVLPGGFGLSPVHGGYTHLFGRFWNGLLAFYDVNVPFEPLSHPRMHGVVIAATFVFCLALGLAIAARRPGIASVVVAAGTAWPATLVPGRNELRLGGFLLAAVLLLYAGLRGRGAVSVRPALVAGSVVVLAALVAASSPAVAKDAFLGWERWNIDSNNKPVSVQFVWDSQYDGIRFPKKATPVFRVAGIARPVYWRATTLDSFNGYGWREQLPWVAFTAQNGRDELVAYDDSYPAAARDRERWQRQVVEVLSLADSHLVGASIPVAYQTPYEDLGFRSGGVASLSELTRRGDQYAVWSYAPEPTANQLQRTDTNYPAKVRRQDLSIAGIQLPAFGDPERSSRLAALLAQYATDDRVGAYRPLYQEAVDVAGEARTPYEAAAAIELWLRTVGGFRYEEQPPRTPGVPALVGFVTRTKAGYCQHYAGAMALMLRYLGVPARVAAGFTSGTYNTEGEFWAVTDHDAHTWVEVWFNGYGWLPFDPTPERGSLNASYTASSQAFDVDRTAPRVAPLLGLTRQALRDRITRDRGLTRGAQVGSSQGPAGAAGSAVRDHGPSLLLLLLLVGVASVAVIGCAKVIVRRARYLSRDPRRIAAACREELVDYLLDQRLEPLPGATLTEVNESLEQRLSVSGRRFVTAATAARFGRPSSAAAEAERSRRELRGLLRAIRRQLTPVERLRGLISLRSLGFR